MEEHFAKRECEKKKIKMRRKKKEKKKEKNDNLTVSKVPNISFCWYQIFGGSSF